MTPSCWAEAPGLEDLVYVLAMARRGQRLSRAKLAVRLGVSVSTLFDWEAGRDAPTLHNLIRWAHAFGLRLVIDGQAQPATATATHIAGETWTEAETRRLITQLYEARRAQKRTQEQLGEALGIVGDSVRRWERLRRTPRMHQLFAWTGELGCTLQLRTIHTIHTIHSQQ